MTSLPAARKIVLLPAFCVALYLPGCASFEKRPDPHVVRAKEKHALFRGQPGWRKNTYRDEKLVAKAAEGNTAVEIALREQRGLLLVDDAIAMDFPVATGRSSHPTPKGSYKILEKKKDHSSNLYGRIVGGDGSTVVGDADTRSHAVPPGGRFVGSPMPYWMRMTTTGVGMHVGHVPGHRAASHGCIRLKRETAAELFSMLAVGTPVKVDSFAPSLGGPVGVNSVVVGEVAEKSSRPRRVSRPIPAPTATASTPATGVQPSVADNQPAGIAAPAASPVPAPNEVSEFEVVVAPEPPSPSATVPAPAELPPPPVPAATP
jgi:lipoprotein-anchoring transpeptidase ErfK/SrfK